MTGAPTASSAARRDGLGAHGVFAVTALALACTVAVFLPLVLLATDVLSFAATLCLMAGIYVFAVLLRWGSRRRFAAAG